MLCLGSREVSPGTALIESARTYQRIIKYHGRRALDGRVLEDARAKSLPCLLTPLLPACELWAHGARHVVHRAEMSVV
eukprot:2263696-Pyramimonas_sp.AAC.1